MSGDGGNFRFCGCDVVALAREYGTPLYVMSEEMITDRIEEVKDCFDERYEGCRTYFAAKSFLSKEMLRILMRHGLGLDVVSGGELHLAREMTFPPGQIAFHGNSKTGCEVRAGLDYGVGKFVCDSVEEIAFIDTLASGSGRCADILIRVTPGVDSHTHRYVATGGVDSKFGVPVDQVEEAVTLCMGWPNIRLRGFHFHVGSQLLENTSHLLALDVVLALIARIEEKTGFRTEVLDMGGGFGIPYAERDRPTPIDGFITPMVERVDAFFRKLGRRRPDLVIEPGRFIVGEAGITLYTVGSVKKVPGVTTYVGVDGGFSDNPRPALYGAEYRAILANRSDGVSAGPVTVVGKCCESGDVLIRDIVLPEVRRGDVLVIFSTGAYNHSMASNYNKNPIPAVVMIEGGTPRLSVRRQTYEEMYACHL